MLLLVLLLQRFLVDNIMLYWLGLLVHLLSSLADCTHRKEKLKARDSTKFLIFLLQNVFWVFFIFELDKVCRIHVLILSTLVYFFDKSSFFQSMCVNKFTS